MLRWRVLTALVLIPGVLWLVWLAPPALLSAAFAGIVVLGAWEWTLLMNLTSHRGRLAYTFAILVIVFGGWLWLSSGGSAMPVLVAGASWWVVAMAWLVAFVRNPSKRRPPLFAFALSGTVVLVAFWFAVVATHDKGAFGPYWVTMLLFLVWGSDTGGYFVGRAWGRHKLAPRLSPGKTWEGVIGSLILGVLLGAVYYACGRALGFAPEGIKPVVFLGLALVTIGSAIVGDLFESMLKRQRGIKDSGGLLPGHGGVLDRIDGLLAAAPILALSVRGIS
ncbi:MAG: phosphatidate cytidylyltransferase [Nitrococcus mobilis]|nr:phosphatidate cytidylyltransferase [Nitrococcus mobilis]